MLLEGAIVLLSQAWACPSLDAALETATVSLVEGGDATAPLADADTSLTCANATRGQVARIWLVRGANAWFTGKKDEAVPLLAAARALAPEGYDGRLGEELKTAWEAAKPGANGNLFMDRNANIDGVDVGNFPLSTAAGPHAIQIIDSAWARTVFVESGEDLHVETGLPVEILADPATAPIRKRKSPALLIAAGGAALAAGACASIAYLQDDAMSAAADQGNGDALESAHTVQVATGYGAYGLAGLAAAGVVFHFVLP